MKKIIQTFLLLSISILNIYAHHGWFWQNPLPQGNYLGEIYFSGNNGIVLAIDGSILKTSNLGGNWILQYSTLSGIYKQIEVFDLNNIYLLSENNDLTKTTNGGLSWSSIPAISGYYPIIQFINMQTGYSLIYSYTIQPADMWNLYKTTNSGNNWLLNKSDSSAIITTFHFPNETTGYAAGYPNSQSPYAKLFKTTNAGSSWDSVYTGIRFATKSIFFIDGNTGFMNTAVSSKLYRTTNGAQTWDSSAHLESNTAKYYFINSATGFVNCGYIKLKTTNAGINWTSHTVPDYSFYYDGVNSYISVGEYGNINRSTNNGLNWNNYTKSVYRGFTNKVEVTDINTAYIGCDNGTILKTFDGGTNWFPIVDPSMDYYQTLYFMNSMTGFGAGLSNGSGSSIKKTTNGGMSWINLNAPNIFTVYDISFPSVNTGYCETKQGGFAKTIDSGNNWFSLGPFEAFAAGGLSFVDNNTGFWVGSSYITGAQIRKTTNGGYNWIETILDSVDMLYDVEFLNDNTGFICGYVQGLNSYHGVFGKTTDQGNSWTLQYTPTGMIYEMSIADINTIFACCDNGEILKSTDAGNSWQAYQSCYSSYIESIDFANANTGYAVSYGGIIIKTTTGGVTIGIEPVSNNIPNEFKLFQNYPNPFNPVTKIKFSIPQNSSSDPVTIYIYDVTGREVQNYSNDNLMPGTYSVDFDGTDLASGVYFYQLISGNFIQTRKMVLLK